MDHKTAYDKIRQICKDNGLQMLATTEILILLTQHSEHEFARGMDEGKKIWEA